jgi:predicted RNA-binding Zn ribbon-like protein
MTVTRDETGSKPAPGRLALVQAFVNTLDLETERDALATPRQLADWLVRHELLPSDTTCSDADVLRSHALREALRGILLANNGLPAPTGSAETLNGVAEHSPLVVRFGGGSSELRPAAGGVAGAHARLLAIVHEAVVSGTWSRLKACRNDPCHWAFYDHSKNRSGTWCTMAVCGSRLKSRAYRRRQSSAHAP